MFHHSNKLVQFTSVSMEQESYLFRTNGFLINFLQMGLRVTAEWEIIFETQDLFWEMVMLTAEFNGSS
jgi:hypothetical protein